MKKRVFWLLLILVTIISPLSLGIHTAKAQGTIFIRADGTVDPSTAPISTADNVTYVLTSDVYSPIAIEKDDTVLDCAGYSIQGTQQFQVGGISLIDRHDVTIAHARIDGFYYGIYVLRTSNSFLVWNDASNSSYGIWLSQSTNNTIYANQVMNNMNGITLVLTSNYNAIARNRVLGNDYGIRFDYVSQYNNVTENNLANNKGDSLLIMSSNNFVYHNNFVNNNAQVFVPGNFSNTWDNGYPSGGNYWRDYSGTDAYSGPGQNLTGSDGIGDTPYVIDSSNQDNYPLMHPWVPYGTAIPATPHYEPWILNLISRREEFDVYVELAEGYNATYIDVSTVKLNDTILAELAPPVVGDFNNNGVIDAMIRFNRTTLSRFILTKGILFGNVSLLVTGQLIDGTLFGGIDSIIVRMPGDVNYDGKVDVRDTMLAAQAFGERPGGLRWNIFADLTEDNVVDIADYYIVCKYYGTIYASP